MVLVFEEEEPGMGPLMGKYLFFSGSK